MLQEWFERHWNEAEDVSDEILKVIERHTRDYLPFEIYAKALQEFFRNHEITAGEWELLQSKMFPVLDQYQKEGYQALIKIANTYRGAFLCDGVGLGKTFIGMMVIERLVMHDRKRVMLLVPKAARKGSPCSTVRPGITECARDFVLEPLTAQRPAAVDRVSNLAELARIKLAAKEHQGSIVALANCLGKRKTPQSQYPCCFPVF